MELIRSLRPLVTRLQRVNPKLADQVKRAATSVALNLKEGNRRKGGDRIQAFRVAFGEADEVDGALQTAVAWGDLDELHTERSLAIVDRLLGLIHGLIRS